MATHRVAWSVGRSICLCVCWLVTFVSHVKTAKPIEMPGGPKKHCVRWGFMRNQQFTTMLFSKTQSKSLVTAANDCLMQRRDASTNCSRSIKIICSGNSDTSFNVETV